MPFQVHQDNILWKIISRKGVQTDLKKLHTLNEKPPAIKKKVGTNFRYNEFTRKVLSSTMEICEPLRKLTALKCEWTSKCIYQNLYDKAKYIIKKNVTMTSYNKNSSFS